LVKGDGDKGGRGKRGREVTQFVLIMKYKIYSHSTIRSRIVECYSKQIVRPTLSSHLIFNIAVVSLTYCSISNTLDRHYEAIGCIESKAYLCFVVTQFSK